MKREPGEITELGFDALASLLRMRGDGQEAARRVMVAGKTAIEVSREMGMAYSNVYASVKRARQGILAARVVLDGLTVPLGKIEEEAQIRAGQRGRRPNKQNSGPRVDVLAKMAAAEEAAPKRTPRKTKAAAEKSAPAKKAAKKAVPKRKPKQMELENV